MTTSILQTWLERLTISRTSPGAMVQESYLRSTVSTPLDDHRHLAVEDDVDLLERRGVRPGAAARQELRQADPLVRRAAFLETLAGAAQPRRDGWAPRRASRRRSAWRASERLAVLDAVLLAAVDHRDEPDDAAVAAIPVDREEGEGAALAGDRVEIAADILDAEDAGLEDLLVDRLPFREVVLPVDARRTIPYTPRRGAAAADRCAAGRWLWPADGRWPACRDRRP